MHCLICNAETSLDLCIRCGQSYIYDALINGYRLKKNQLVHSHIRESRLRIILNRLYGKNNVIEEVVFTWCKNPVTGACMRYDFAVTTDKTFLIEFNGEQHYKYIKFFHKNKETFKEQQIRDKIKKEKAKEFGYPLLIVPFNIVLTETNIKKEISKLFKRK